MSAYLAATSSVQVGDIRGAIHDWRFPHESATMVDRGDEEEAYFSRPSSWHDAASSLPDDDIAVASWDEAEDTEVDWDYTDDMVKGAATDAASRRPWQDASAAGREVLCAVDPADAVSAYAFNWMVREQLRDGDRVHLVHVLPERRRVHRRFSAPVFGRRASGGEDERPACLLSVDSLSTRRRQEAEQAAGQLATFIRENWPVTAIRTILPHHANLEEGEEEGDVAAMPDHAQPGLNVHIVLHILHGDAKDVLVRVIDDLLPSFVVIGAGTGATSSRVIQHSLVPVMVARDPTRDAKRLAASLGCRAAALSPVTIPVAAVCS